MIFISQRFTLITKIDTKIDVICQSFVIVDVSIFGISVNSKGAIG